MADTSDTTYTGALDWIAEALSFKREGLIYAARELAAHLSDLADVLRTDPEAALAVEEIRDLADHVVDQAMAIRTLRRVRTVAQAEADGRS